MSRKISITTFVSFLLLCISCLLFFFQTQFPGNVWVERMVHSAVCGVTPYGLQLKLTVYMYISELTFDFNVPHKLLLRFGFHISCVYVGKWTHKTVKGTPMGNTITKRSFTCKQIGKKYFERAKKNETEINR